MPSEKRDPVRVALEGRLAGHHVLVDDDELDFGFLADVQSQNANLVLGSLGRAIVGGDLPKGTDTAGLRKLKPIEVGLIVQALTGLFDLPKAG